MFHVLIYFVFPSSIPIGFCQRGKPSWSSVELSLIHPEINLKILSQEVKTCIQFGLIFILCRLRRLSITENLSRVIFLEYPIFFQGSL